MRQTNGVCLSILIQAFNGMCLGILAEEEALAYTNAGI